MSLKEKLEVLERIAEIATLAGLKGEIDEENLRFITGYEFEDSRRQMVFVRDTTRNPEQRIVTLYSPCLMVKKGLLGGVSKAMALELLRANENLHFARFGVLELPKETLIVASVDHLLDTLDPPEFEASALHVALAADQYEHRHGQDEF